jgi:hypothetical protein
MENVIGGYVEEQELGNGHGGEVMLKMNIKTF